MQTLTWTDLASRERMSLILWLENIHIFSLIIIKNTHISFSLILAGILHAGKKRFLGTLAVRFVCRMHSTFYCKSSHSACAQRMRTGKPSNFSRENISSLHRRVPYRISIFYVNQQASMLNFARGQTSADDTCVY